MAVDIQDDDIFDLTEIISSGDDVLDLSENDKAESSPAPKPVPANAQEAEDMDLDDLLSQLDTNDDSQDENLGLPPQEEVSAPAPAPSAEPVPDMDLDLDLALEPEASVAAKPAESSSDMDFDLDLDFGKPSDDFGDDDFGDITAAINQKREAFDADLENSAPKSSGSSSQDDDIDDLFAELGGSTNPSGNADASREMLEELGDLDFGSDDDDSFADVDDILKDLDLNDLDFGSTPSPKASPSDDFDLDDLDFESTGEDLAKSASPASDDDDPFADIDDLLDESASASTKTDDDLDSLLGEFNEMTGNTDGGDIPTETVAESEKDEIDVDFPDDLDDFIKDTETVLDPIIDDTILDIDTSEAAESIEFTEEVISEENSAEIEEKADDADISSYIDEFDILPNQDEQILTVEGESPPIAQAPIAQAPIAQTSQTTVSAAPLSQAMPSVIQSSLSNFDNTNNQTQLNLLFAEFRLLSSEIAELKRRERTGDKDILLPIVGKELSCRDIEENLAHLRSKLKGFETNMSAMQEEVQNTASELAVDAEGEERSSIDNFIMEMSESFDSFAKSLTSFDNKISEMEKANTEMETSMTVLRTKVEKNAAKIDLLSTRIDNLDASFANIEGLVATTAARIIREELAALLAEEEGGILASPVSAPAPTQAPAPIAEDVAEPLEDDFAMPEEPMSEVLEEVEIPVVEAPAVEEEINFDEMLDAPIETVASPEIVATNVDSTVTEAIDPFEALAEAEGATEEVADTSADLMAEMGIDISAGEAVANAVPEEFDMDALFDTEAK